MKEFVVEENEEKRIDVYLSGVLDVSRSLVQKMIDQGIVLVNGHVVKANYLVKNKDQVEITGEYLEEMTLEAENIPLDIVYEDEDVLLINKPSGMVVHPGSGVHSHTLVNALLYYTNHLSDCNGEIRPGIVHRIDKDTSGLLLVAKNNKAHEILAKDFQNKRVKRKYLALVRGVLQHNHITIDAPIGRDPIHRKKMMVTDKNSKKAVTHVKVLKRYRQYTLVECSLETGRTHQIRVHLAYIGYPIHNDPVYNSKKADDFGQFLHSYEIEFRSPLTQKELHFTCPLPKEFQDFLDSLE